MGIATQSADRPTRAMYQSYPPPKNNFKRQLSLLDCLVFFRKRPVSKGGEPAKVEENDYSNTDRTLNQRKTSLQEQESVVEKSLLWSDDHDSTEDESGLETGSDSETLSLDPEFGVSQKILDLINEELANLGRGTLTTER